MVSHVLSQEINKWTKILPHDPGCFLQTLVQR